MLTVGKFNSINDKYRSAPLRNNRSHSLSRDGEEGTRYTLPARLERVVQEFAERIDLALGR